MSDAEWDADDFEPTVSKDGAAAPKVVATDKWDGEDEDDDVKDAWDAEEGEEQDPDAPKAVQRKKKKKITDIIAEKEAAKEAEEEVKRKQEAAAKAMNTPEGKLAEKLRQTKIEEQNNLQLAKEMFGQKSVSIDSIIPVSKEEFDQFEKALSEKITLFSSSELYGDFVENLVKALCVDLNTTTLKKIKMNVEAMHQTKLKAEKEAAAKKKKGKGGSLKMDITKDIFSGSAGADYDGMDDFM